MYLFLCLYVSFLFYVIYRGCLRQGSAPGMVVKELPKGTQSFPKYTQSVPKVCPKPPKMDPKGSHGDQGTPPKEALRKALKVTKLLLNF